MVYLTVFGIRLLTLNLYYYCFIAASFIFNFNEAYFSEFPSSYMYLNFVIGPDVSACIIAVESLSMPIILIYALGEIIIRLKEASFASFGFLHLNLKEQ